MRSTPVLVSILLLNSSGLSAETTPFPFVPKKCLHLFEPYAEVARRAPVACLEHGGLDDRGKEFFAVATRASDGFPRAEVRMVVRRVAQTIELSDTTAGGGELADYAYLVLASRIAHSGSHFSKVIVKLDSENADARDARTNGWSNSRLGKTLIRLGFVNVKEIIGGSVEFSRKVCEEKVVMPPPANRWDTRVPVPVPGALAELRYRLSLKN